MFFIYFFFKPYTCHKRLLFWEIGVPGRYASVQCVCIQYIGSSFIDGDILYMVASSIPTSKAKNHSLYQFPTIYKYQNHYLTHAGPSRGQNTYYISISREFGAKYQITHDFSWHGLYQMSHDSLQYLSTKIHHPRDAIIIKMRTPDL